MLNVIEVESADQFGQPGNPHDIAFGDQLKREVEAYKQMRNNGELSDAQSRLSPMEAVDAQVAFRESLRTKSR